MHVVAPTYGPSPRHPELTSPAMLAQHACFSMGVQCPRRRSTNALCDVMVILLLLLLQAARTQIDWHARHLVQLTKKVQPDQMASEEHRMFELQRVLLQRQIAHLRPGTDMICCVVPSAPPLSTTTTPCEEDLSSRSPVKSIIPCKRPHSLPAPSRRRTKRFYCDRACQRCDTRFTSQWRSGPGGPSTYAHLTPLSPLAHLRGHWITLAFPTEATSQSLSYGHSILCRVSSG